MRNLDVPGVVGHIGAVLGSHHINIGNFSLGRSDSEPVESIAVITTDAPVTLEILEQLKANSAVKIARAMQATESAHRKMAGES
ncbi:MAG TPA: ACT domain-containing protein [Bryobacteraceae bacterium]|nr:ACT domain-containing protein [Bryobacteraceae bacterium]